MNKKDESKNIKEELQPVTAMLNVLEDIEKNNEKME